MRSSEYTNVWLDAEGVEVARPISARQADRKERMRYENWMRSCRASASAFWVLSDSRMSLAPRSNLRCTVATAFCAASSRFSVADKLSSAALASAHAFTTSPSTFRTSLRMLPSGYNHRSTARMVKLVDTGDSKSPASDSVSVRVRLWAPYLQVHRSCHAAHPG